MTSSTDYASLAAEYDAILGGLAKLTWQQGVIAELRRIGLPPDAAIVDLGAGTGIGGQMLGTLAAGLHRTAVDRSAAMLTKAGRHYERVVVSDIGDLVLDDATTDVVVSGFDTLNYLDPAKLAQCLRRVHRCLKPGGWLIFDYSSPQLLRHEWRQRGYVYDLPDGAVHWQHRYEPASQCCVSVVERRDSANGVQWHETHVQYALDTYAFQDLAATAGLHVDRVRDLDGAHFSPSAHTHVWTIRKEAT
jgi:ubiquinone/menaquinone biosynthesis C-methylase UbiE